MKTTKIEAPANHSDLAKIEEKRAYIALETPLAAYDTGAGASGMETNKQISLMIAKKNIEIDYAKISEQTNK